MPLTTLTIPVDNTNGISTTWNFGGIAIANQWSSSIAANNTFTFSGSTAYGAGIAFRFQVPSLVDLPLNTLITSAKIKASGSIINGTPSNFTYTYIQNTISGTFPLSGMIITPSVYGSFAIPPGINSPYSFTNTLGDNLVDPSVVYLTRTAFLAAINAVPSIDVINPSNFGSYAPFFIALPVAGTTVTSGSIAWSNINLQIEYYPDSDQRCYYNPLTNHFQRTLINPGSPWQAVTCPDPNNVTFSVDPIFGSINGGD